MKLDKLAQNIQSINVTLQDNAAKAINKSVTALSGIS